MSVVGTASARRCRDQLPDDDVLLQPEQPVDLAFDRGVGRTFVVSWKDAAERKDSVASDAFVIPRISGSEVACSFFAFLTRVFSRSSTIFHELAGQELGVAVVLDPTPFSICPDDELDVLVVDLDALRLVDLLHLADEVQLGLGVALQVRRSDGLIELVERVTRLDVLALRDAEPRPARDENRGRPPRSGVGDDRDPQLALGPRGRPCPPPRRASRRPSGCAPRRSRRRGRPCVMSAPATPPVWNVRIVSCVRLADRLRGDDSDRVSDKRQLPVARKVP
jgi:hypothetical protein